MSLIHFIDVSKSLEDEYQFNSCIKSIQTAIEISPEIVEELNSLRSILFCDGENVTQFEFEGRKDKNNVASAIRKMR